MEVVKNVINWMSSPEILFGLSTLFCFVGLKPRWLWTNKAGLVGLVGFVVFFAASMLDPNFRIIVSKPDNVPIVMLFAFVGFFLWLSLKQAHENDERIEAGGELVRRLARKKMKCSSTSHQTFGNFRETLGSFRKPSGSFDEKLVKTYC